MRSKLCASLSRGSKAEPAATGLANPGHRRGPLLQLQPQCPAPMSLQPNTLPRCPGENRTSGASCEGRARWRVSRCNSLLNPRTLLHPAPSTYPPTAPAPCLAALRRRSRAAARASASAGCLLPGRWVSPATLRASRRAYLVKPLHKSLRQQTLPARGRSQVRSASHTWAPGPRCRNAGNRKAQQRSEARAIAGPTETGPPQMRA